MTGATDPARVFLDAFADIERLLRQKANVEEYVEFAKVVDGLEPRDRLVREHRAALKAFASLRNAIVHDRYRSGQPIATPHPDVVGAICDIRDLLERPPRIGAVVQGRGQVAVVPPGVGVWQALRSMTQRDHSQVLVYGEAGYVGLLTTNAIARWAASQVNDAGEILAEEAPVAEVLHAAEEFEVAKFVARDAAVVDVIDLLTGAAGRPAPVAVVVTHSGEESESALGILVVHDLPELLALVTVAF